MTRPLAALILLLSACDLFAPPPGPFDAGTPPRLVCRVASGVDAQRGSCGAGNLYCDNFQCCPGGSPIRGFDQLCYRTVEEAEASGAAGCTQCVPGFTGAGGGSGGGGATGGGAASGGGGGSTVADGGLDCSPWDLASCVVCTSYYPQQICQGSNTDTITDCTNSCTVPARIRVCNQRSNLTCACAESVLLPGANWGVSTQTNVNYTCFATNTFRAQAAMTTGPVACLNLDRCAF